MHTLTRPQRGFSLIELLIGMAIGLVGLFAVGQIMNSFNKQRNTINQTIATQNNGVMALYVLERDLSQAGYGLANLGCDRIHYYLNGTGYYNSPWGTTTLPGNNNVALSSMPVRIISGGTGSDTIEIQYGKPNSGAPGAQIIAAQTTSYADAYSVGAATGLIVGDVFVASVGGTCTMAQVTALTTPDPANAVSVTYPVTTAVAHATGASAYNVAAAPGGTGWNTVSALNVSSTPKPFLANLGAFVSRRYSLGSTGLVLAEFTTLGSATTSLPVMVDDIVFMKAQYGLASSASSTAVASWASGEDLSTAVYDSTKAARVVAIRVGVVARSPLLEKADVDAPSTLSVLPAVSGTSTTSAPASGECNTDGTSREVKCTVQDKHYRYRAYSTIIPLKNVIWTR